MKRINKWFAESELFRWTNDKWVFNACNNKLTLGGKCFHPASPVLLTNFPPNTPTKSAALIARLWKHTTISYLIYWGKRLVLVGITYYNHGLMTGMLWLTTLLAQVYDVQTVEIINRDQDRKYQHYRLIWLITEHRTDISIFPLLSFHRAFTCVGYMKILLPSIIDEFRKSGCRKQHITN